MNIIRENCAVCGNNLKHIYDLSHIPVSLYCVEFGDEYNYDTLSFSKCMQCNTIQLDKLIPLEILYKSSHNAVSVGNVWEQYYSLFIDKISHIVNDKVVLEIGCPSGKLATKCNNYSKWYIVDPNKNERVQFDNKIIFIQEFFNETFKSNDRIDVILHSHLFEHIYDPNCFLQKCHELLSDEGEMVFGVPNMEHLSKISLFLGVFFEHTIFLNKTNITYLLHKNGFEILEILDYKKHSTIYHVKKSKIQYNITECNVLDYLEQFITMNSEYKEFVNTCNAIISNHLTKPVYIFGASYNTQFLLNMGIDERRLTGILDNCKEKQNKYLYGTQLRIFSPELIVENDPIVILKNGYYTQEIFIQLKTINPNVIIICNDFNVV